MTIIEFLEARISEDERAVAHRDDVPHAAHLWDVHGAYSPECPDCRGLPGKERALAECAAKRAIVDHAAAIGDDGYSTAEYMPSREHEKSPGEVGDRRIYPGHPSFTQTVIYSRILRHLAAIYKDHPDYRQEWAPNGG